MLPGPLIPQIAPGYYSTRETIAHNFALQAANPRTSALKAVHQPGERHIPESERPRKPTLQRKSHRPTGARFAHADRTAAFAASNFYERAEENSGVSQPKPARASTREQAGISRGKQAIKRGASRLPRFSSLNSFPISANPAPTRGSASRRAATPRPGRLPHRQLRQGRWGRKHGTRGCR